MDLQMIGIRMGTIGSNLLPNLSLDFAETKALDPRITFTRASSGTYWDADGVLQTATTDEPRFTHNPATGESLGLLVEGAATNLLTYSDDFANAAWASSSANGVVISNQATAPDGTMTADKVAVATSQTTGDVRNSNTLSVGATYALSVFAKAAEFSNVFLGGFPFGGGAPSVAVNLLTGEVTANSAGLSVLVEDVGNDWWRIRISGGAYVAGPDFIYIGTSGTGDDTSGIYIWRAQLETGSIATSPIKTEASTVTRAADVATMTGTNFSDWYNASEGAFYVQCVPAALSVGAGISANDNTTNERIRVAAASTTDQATVTDGGADQAVLDGGTPVAGSALKLAMSYKANDFALSLNGGTVATDTGGTIPTVTQLQLGAETTTTGNLTIAKLSYYPRSLPDAQLQVITA
jgi:hypothetical protein